MNAQVSSSENSILWESCSNSLAKPLKNPQLPIQADLTVFINFTVTSVFLGCYLFSVIIYSGIW